MDTADFDRCRHFPPTAANQISLYPRSLRCPTAYLACVTNTDIALVLAAYCALTTLPGPIAALVIAAFIAGRLDERSRPPKP